ncbi:hypothetical protein D3C87_1124450 [compost metagenome]
MITDPLTPPKQLTFVWFKIDATGAFVEVIVTERVLVQPRVSVTTTVWVPAGNPLKVAPG